MEQRRDAHDNLNAPLSCSEVEQALLGAMLCNEDVRNQVRCYLRAEDFYDVMHGRVFQHLCDLDCPVDVALLKASSEFSRLSSCFDELIAKACPTADVHRLAKKLHKYLVLRRLLEAQTELGLDLQEG